MNEQRPDTDVLIGAAAEAIRRVAIAEWDDADGMIVAEGYPFDQARAVITTLADLVTGVRQAVEDFARLPASVREAAIRSVSAGRCNNCGCTGFRLTHSIADGEWLCDGCYAHQNGMPPVPSLPDPIPARRQ